jgi:hypothetical protein
MKLHLLTCCVIFSGFSSELLNLITRSDLEHLIKVHIALGKVLANVHRGADSVVAYQNALQVNLFSHVHLKTRYFLLTHRR